jgi:hypothetical protein
LTRTPLGLPVHASAFCCRLVVTQPSSLVATVGFSIETHRCQVLTPAPALWSPLSFPSIGSKPCSLIGSDQSLLVNWIGSKSCSSTGSIWFLSRLGSPTSINSARSLARLARLTRLARVGSVASDWLHPVSWSAFVRLDLF